MNEKEIREIRRRYKAEKSMVDTVCGCCVNETGNIITTFRESLSTMSEDESAKFLGVLKKSISGKLGKNLMNIDFSARQVSDGAEHKLLMRLNESGLKDDAVLAEFYEKVMSSLHIKGNYLILVSRDDYSVPYRSTDGKLQTDASDEVYSYVLCGICPVKQMPQKLGYDSTENRFLSTPAGWAVGAPELGFLFPAFNDRASDIYAALYYSKSAKDDHKDFVDAVFRVEPPMPAAVQKETFDLLLAGSLGEECSLKLVQAVNGQLGDMIEEHKHDEEEPLMLSGSEIGDVLRECGVSEEKAEAFAAAFDEQFGKDAAISPVNMIESGRFIMKTGDSVIKIDPTQSSLVKTRLVDGIQYILVPAGGGVEVNGVNIKMSAEQ